MRSYQENPLVIQDDIPVNPIIHDIFMYNTTKRNILSIPNDDNMLLEEFMKMHMKSLEIRNSSSNTDIPVYILYVINDEFVAVSKDVIKNYNSNPMNIIKKFINNCLLGNKDYY